MVYCATSFFTHMDVGIKLLTSRWQNEKFKIKVLLETDGLHLLQRLRKWQNYAELESHFVDIHFSSRNTRKQLLHLTCTLTFLLALEMPLKDSSIKQNSSLLRWKMSSDNTDEIPQHILWFWERKANLSLGDRKACLLKGLDADKLLQLKI